MPLNSVQLYTKSLLDGLVIPTFEVPLVAYVAPPMVDEPSGPVAYLWGGVSYEKRQTMPRGMGFKTIRYELDCWLLVFDEATAIGADSNFPVVIDTVVTQLASAASSPMPVQITDSISGVTSHIISIGESVSVDYAPVRTLEDQRYVRYDARLILTIEEQIQR